MRSNTTVILATFPPEKDHGAALARNRTSRVPNDMTRKPTFPGFGNDPLALLLPDLASILSEKGV